MIFYSFVLLPRSCSPSAKYPPPPQLELILIVSLQSVFPGVLEVSFVGLENYLLCEMGNTGSESVASEIGRVNKSIVHQFFL